MSALSVANTSAAFLQRSTRHTGDQIYCAENCVCLTYMEQRSGNVITKFISIPPWLEGWAWLCCWFFLIEGEVIVPSPSSMSDRAVVGHRSVTGSCGWNFSFPLHLHLYCLLNQSAQRLNQKHLSKPGLASSFVAVEFCGPYTGMMGAFL